MMPGTDADLQQIGLQHQLDRITANTRALVQPERLAQTEAVIDALRAGGLESRIAAPGCAAPSFRLMSAAGKPVRSEDLYSLGPVILKFFRGRWCPYDMTELEAWQAVYARVREKGALLVALSPQTPRQNAFTAEQHRLTFPVLSDPGAQIASTLGLAYTVPGDTQRWYRSMLVNVPFLNGDESWRLPLPAVAIVRQDPAAATPEPKIVSLTAQVDHRLRPEPEQILASL